MILADDFIEHEKIGWRIEPAAEFANNPLLEPKYPWDDGVVGCGHGTVLKDPIDGRFKAWIASVSEDLEYVRGQTQFRCTYLVSEDGTNWERPMLDVCPVPGHEKTNILFDFDSGGRSTYMSVHIEPERRPDEPYEMFVYRDAFFRNPNLCVTGFGQEPARDQRDAYEKYYGLYRYRSADGIHWRPLDGPHDLQSGDTLYVHRDPEIGYVAHHKNSFPSGAGGFVPYDVDPGGCRTSLRKTSPDGTHWTDSRVILKPDWQDHQADQIMELGRYPYGGGFIGLLAVYHAMSQTMDLQLNASRDGIEWWRVSRAPCLANKPLGDYGGGMYWPTRTLIEHEGRLVLYYGALDGLHGDIYSESSNCLHFHGAFCGASWEKGRMWAAVSSEGGMCPGRLTTAALHVAGKRLHLNAATLPRGVIRCELLDEHRQVIPGYSKEDCIPFTGDAKRQPVGWRGHDTCEHATVHLRLCLTRGLLYGFEWS